MKNPCIETIFDSGQFSSKSDVTSPFHDVPISENDVPIWRWDMLMFKAKFPHWKYFEKSPCWNTESYTNSWTLFEHKAKLCNSIISPYYDACLSNLERVKLVKNPSHIRFLHLHTDDFLTITNMEFIHSLGLGATLGACIFVKIFEGLDQIITDTYLMHNFFLKPFVIIVTAYETPVGIDPSYLHEIMSWRIENMTAYKYDYAWRWLDRKFPSPTGRRRFIPAIDYLPTRWESFELGKFLTDPYKPEVVYYRELVGWDNFLLHPRTISLPKIHRPV